MIHIIHTDSIFESVKASQIYVFESCIMYTILSKQKVNGRKCVDKID